MKRSIIPRYLGFLLIAVLIIFQFQIMYGTARKEEVPGFIEIDQVESNEGIVVYDFLLGNEVNFTSNVHVNLDIELDSHFANMNVQLNISAKHDLNVTIIGAEYDDSFEEKSFKLNHKIYKHKWIAYFEISTNTSADLLIISIPLSMEEYLETHDQWASFDTRLNKWIPLDTFYDESSGILEVHIVDPDNQSFVTIFEADEELPIGIVIFISIISIIGLSLIFSVSKPEFRDFYRNKLFPESMAGKILSNDEIFENENRLKILELIIDQPGIHFNEILKITGMQTGNLAWHLDILINYNIIGKQNTGRYLIYFPYFDINPLSNIDLCLVKTQDTIKILCIIEEYSSIEEPIIAKLIKLDKKTTHYHIEKLIENNLIKVVTEGKKSLLYPSVGKLKELKLDYNTMLQGKPESEE